MKEKANVGVMVIGALLLLAALLSACAQARAGGLEPAVVEPEGTTNPQGVAVFGPDQARDAVLAHLAEQDERYAPASSGLQWTERNVTPQQRLGGSTFQYTAKKWRVTVAFPIVAPQSTLYQVVVENDALDLRWEGQINAAGEIAEGAL